MLSHRNYFLIFIIFSLTGCASVDVDGYTVPGELLSTTDEYYIITEEKDEHYLNLSLNKAMLARGFDVSYGKEDQQPLNTRYLVEYAGQWQWDITWYLLHFSMQIYDPTNHLLIASGHSRRTSLVRKPQEDMINEVLNQLFEKKLKEEVK